MIKQKLKTEIELLYEISEKLDDLIATFLIQGKERESQINILVNRGYSNSNISIMIGIPKGTVDTIRAKMKKKK